MSFLINTKECLAVYYAAHSFVHVLKPKHVCVISENTTAVSSYLNKKLDQFIAWHHDLFAVVVDAFSLSWSQFNLPYAFPPNSIVMRVFQQIRGDNVTIIIVIPIWTTLPWWPILFHCLTDVPRKLPCHTPLYLPWNPAQEHLLGNKISLVKAEVSGVLHVITTFRQKLKSTLSSFTEIVQGSTMDVNL